MEITKELLEELYIVQELSPRDISEKLKISKRMINRKLKEFGIPLRDKKTAQRIAIKKWGERHRAQQTECNLQCELCGKDIYVKKSQLKASAKHFCSASCSTKYYNQFKKRTGEYVECDYCKKKHYKNQYVLKTFKNHFCCKECHNKWMAENSVGENNPQYERISVECSYCGKELKRINSIVEKQEKHYCNKDCMSKHYVGLVCGENHPSWKGGYRGLYYGPNWKEVRQQARERDNHTCQRCGMTEEKLGHALPVHHIKPLRECDSWEDANVLDNLITLCPTCHGTVEQNGMDFKI